MHHDRRTVVRAGVAGVVGFLSGCIGGGGGDGAAGSPTPIPTASPTASPTETATPSPSGTPDPVSAQERYPDYAWGQLDGVEPEPASTIEMRGFAFSPLVATVAPGTAVTLVNRDGAGHTVTVPMLGIDEQLGGGASTTISIGRTGTFDYVCAFHPPDMLGRLVVTDQPPTPEPTATPTPSPTATPTPTDEEEDDDGYYSTG